MSVQPDVVLAACPACGNAIVKLDHVQKCVDKLKLDRRGYRLMACRMIDIVANSSLMDDLEAGKYERASGEAECSECRLLYREHPQVPKMPTFHITCLGKIVKT